MSKDERHEMFEKMVVNCANKEGASEADIDAILAHTEPSTYEGKCIGACMGSVTRMVYFSTSH